MKSRMQAATFLGDSLAKLHVRPLERREEARYQAQMACHHILANSRDGNWATGARGPGSRLNIRQVPVAALNFSKTA